MGNEHGTNKCSKKKSRPIDRDVNTALYLLRAVQVGLSLHDLDLISMGTVSDMFTESLNDEYDYPQKATKADIARL